MCFRFNGNCRTYNTDAHMHTLTLEHTESHFASWKIGDTRGHNGEDKIQVDISM